MIKTANVGRTLYAMAVYGLIFLPPVSKPNQMIIGVRNVSDTRAREPALVVLQWTDRAGKNISSTSTLSDKFLLEPGRKKTWDTERDKKFSDFALTPPPQSYKLRAVADDGVNELFIQRPLPDLSFGTSTISNDALSVVIENSGNRSFFQPVHYRMQWLDRERNVVGREYDILDTAGLPSGSERLLLGEGFLENRPKAAAGVRVIADVEDTIFELDEENNAIDIGDFIDVRTHYADSLPVPLDAANIIDRLLSWFGIR